MILLLGATSYVGQAFARALRRRKDTFVPLSRNAFDYTRFEFLFDYVRKMQPDFVINAADSAQKLNGNPDELERLEMLQSNTLLPQTVARVCSSVGVPWAHISSGNIYTGAKVIHNGGFKIEEDLSRPVIREMFVHHPECFRGYSELDQPNFCFKSAPCTFYSGTKALAEEALQDQQRLYVWRFQLPFNEADEPRNFLTQLRDRARFRDAINSCSQVDDCVAACLELWDRQAPFGTYNVVNPGAVCTHEIAQLIQRKLKPQGRFELLLYDDASARFEGQEPCSDCILDVSKLLCTGIKLRHVHDALEHSLARWIPQASHHVQTSV
ncbi:MAG TPA: sugar nucleotide-binding protein [Verrucomicrobiae bacterium]|nr:sugar nucleotide-binding protein [Verrucomicrobiae bacterium]